MNKHLFIACLLGLCGLSSSAQIYHPVNGSANPGGSCYCMTQSGESATAIWVNEGLSLSYLQNNSISREFEIYLGDDDAGGQGIAFLLQQEGPTAIGSGGSALGYGGSSGILSSVAIEIDTRRNTHDGTPITGKDHLSAHFNGNHTLTPTGSSPVLLGEMEDGAYHRLRIDWTYDPVNPENSALTATIDNIYSLSIQFDPASLFGASSVIYYGFSAGVSTAQSNSQKVSFTPPGDAGSCSAQLSTFPVEWVSFTATPQGGGVALDWITAEEVNHAYFEIQRSTDTRLWQAIGEVAEHHDYDGTLRNYQFVDFQLAKGYYYYRLRQVDIDGRYSFSAVRGIAVDRVHTALLQAYPNPAHDQLQVELGNLPENESSLLLVLQDGLGRVLRQQALRADFVGRIPLKISDLSPGIYHLAVRSAQGQIAFQRILKR